MKSSDIYGQKVDWIPGLPYTKEVLEVIQTRARLLGAMSQHPGFRAVAAKWRERRLKARIGAPADTDAALDATAVLTDTLGSLCDIVPQYEELAKQLAGQVGDDRTGIPSDGMTETEAQAAVNEGAVVSEMTQLPGWSILVREIGARIRVLYDLLGLCRGPARETIRQYLRAQMVALGDVQLILDLGMDAEAWQERHVLGAMKGKELGDA